MYVTLSISIPDLSSHLSQGPYQSRRVGSDKIRVLAAVFGRYVLFVCGDAVSGLHKTREGEET
jgi:hypothetical protein